MDIYVATQYDNQYHDHLPPIDRYQQLELREASTCWEALWQIGVTPRSSTEGQSTNSISVELLCHIHGDVARHSQLTEHLIVESNSFHELQVLSQSRLLYKSWQCQMQMGH